MLSRGNCVISNICVRPICVRHCALNFKALVVVYALLSLSVSESATSFLISLQVLMPVFLLLKLGNNVLEYNVLFIVL